MFGKNSKLPKWGFVFGELYFFWGGVIFGGSAGKYLEIQCLFKNNPDSNLLRNEPNRRTGMTCGRADREGSQQPKAKVTTGTNTPDIDFMHLKIKHVCICVSDISGGMVQERVHTIQWF